MSREAYARGFTKVAEAHGVDPVGLAKYAAGISTNPAAKKLGEKAINALVRNGAITLPSKRSIFDWFNSLLGKIKKGYPRSVNYDLGVSTVKPEYLDKTRKQFDYMAYKNSRTGIWDPKNLEDVAKRHYEPINLYDANPEEAAKAWERFFQAK